MNDNHDSNLETSTNVLRRDGQTRNTWQDRPRTDADSPRPEYTKTEDDRATDEQEETE